jgi:diguanylate cyclase (GGDEF)-like protein/putative nucleotidyltransferase with HDIG domain
MVFRSQFTGYASAYLWSVILAGAIVLGGSIIHLVQHPIGAQWFILAALTLISGSATVKLPSSYASISISETFVITGVLLFGPAAGTVLTALDALVISLRIAKRHDEAHRVLFNVSAPAFSAWCSAHLFFFVAAVPPLSQGAPTGINALLPALVLFALTYFALNSWLVTLVVAIERNLNPFFVWRTGFLWLSLNYFAGASVAVLFVGFTRTIDLGFIGIIIPLLLVLYFTFKTTMARVEDADRHVEQLNRLYLSTIETFAMAIDAKDQVTHGHIRRVQLYAIGLAREVGVRDDNLIKAIEAAALLHDMGKLAVPEYILNKPGKLTETEFEKMKLHAGVGADILSAVDFPYPVVPIVRHHHENWDGTGYPSGLKGVDIPIGARILSVVDCFDALTSDRPYRPRLSEEESLKIIVERRGTMYDPLIVDTFVRVHKAIAPEPIQGGPPTRALNEIVTARKTVSPQLESPVLDEISASADEMLKLYDLARGLAGQVSVVDAGDIIAKHIRRLIPASLCIFYVYDSVADELEAKHAVGEGVSLVRGMRIALGERLSGWVAANRQTISNSDPVLDLGEVARTPTLRLRSCLSTPLLHGKELVGVLSLYSTDGNAFSEDHRRVIEVVAHQIAITFKKALTFDGMPRRDALTGLPHLNQFEQFVQSDSSTFPNADFSLLFIDVSDLKTINTNYGRDAGDDVLRHVVRQARSGLRVADILFRNASDEFVAFLHSTDRDTAEHVADRIRHRIRDTPLSLAADRTITVQASVTIVSAPGDGSSLPDLLTAAKRKNPAVESSRSRVH